MKKKIILGIVIFSLSIVLITILTLRIINHGKEVVLNCKKTNETQEIECEITGKVKKYKVSCLSMKLDVSNNAKLEEVKVDSIWQGSGSKGFIELYTDKDKTGKFNIVKFKIKANNKKTKIKLSNIKLYDQDYKEHKVADISKNI